MVKRLNEETQDHQVLLDHQELEEPPEL